MSSEATATVPEESPKNPWAALLVLCLGFFVILLDATIVNVAIPTMLASLQASLDQILWVVNAYLLALAVLLITAGRLGDIFGQRNLFVIGLAAFAAASAVCGLAGDANQLIAARVAQGVGAAIMSPQALVIITAIFPAGRRGAALGVLSAVTALASVAGPTLGGLIVTNLDWRWIFYVNVPIGAAGIILAYRYVPDIRPGRRHRLDLGGVTLATAGLTAVIFGLIEGQRYSWGQVGGSFVTIPEIIAVGVLVLVGFVVWERFQKEPLLPLTLFRNRNYTMMVWLTGLLLFGMFGFVLTTTIYLQSVLGFTAIHAGLTTLPLSAGIIVVAPFAGRLTDRVGGRYVVMVGLLLFASGLAGVAWLASASSTSLTFAFPLAIAGVGMGAVIAPTMTVAMHDIAPMMTGAASGLLNTSRQVGAAIGSAVIGAVLQARLTTAMHDQAATAAQKLPIALRQRFVDGFATAAGRGLEVGKGQSGAAGLPAGIPAQAARQIAQLSHDVFVNSYVAAMGPTIAVAVVALVVGAATCWLISGYQTTVVGEADVPGPALELAS